MDGSLKPKRREHMPQERPISQDVFYANGINIDINPNELILTFDRLLPGAEPDAKSIVLNANAVYQLRDALSGMIEQHEKSLKEMAENARTRKDN